VVIAVIVLVQFVYILKIKQSRIALIFRTRKMTKTLISFTVLILDTSTELK